jgi:beta-glucosidase
LRALDPDLRLGTILSVQPGTPVEPDDADRCAADLYDAVWHGAHLDPLARGRYPDAVAPDAFRDVLLRLSADPGLPPLVVTEDGAAFDDRPDADGRVRDGARVAYLRRYLAALAEARARGARADGYFVWTLLDNFEWAVGYAKRFGLVRVEQQDLRRVPKASYDAHARFVAAGGAPPETEEDA